jgi:hypothetical protein
VASPPPARPPASTSPVPVAPVLIVAVLVGTVLYGAVLIAAGLVCGLGAWLGAWWLPFLVGLAVGVLGTPGSRLPWLVPRGGVPAAVAGAVLGWAVPLWVLALRGQPVGATARAIAALAGLPPHAAVAVTVTLLLAALQVLAGAWLARAVMPRSRPRTEPEAPAPAPEVTVDPRT